MFDYTYGDGTPAKYDNPISTSKPSITGTWVNYGGATSTDNPKSCEVDFTSGQTLYSLSQMMNQKSCIPHSFNAGNYYNFPAISASTPEPATLSVCPKGWTLPQNGTNTGYVYFLLAYGIDYSASSRTNQDSALLNLPLSFLRSGYYRNYGTLSNQGSRGYYRMSSQVLNFHLDYLNPTHDTYADYGYSVRCVSR